MNRYRPNVEREGWVDRLLLALAAALIGGLTMLGYIAIVALCGLTGPAMGLGHLFFSKFGLGVVASCAVVGALVGLVRLAELFSILWGTHPGWTTRGWQLAAMAAAGVVLLMLVWRGWLWA